MLFLEIDRSLTFVLDLCQVDYAFLDVVDAKTICKLNSRGVLKEFNGFGDVSWLIAFSLEHLLEVFGLL